MRRFKYLLLLLSLFYIGCSTSRFSEEEKLVEMQQYRSAIRKYLSTLEPHVRGGKQYIYYDKDVFTGIGTVFWHMGKYDRAIKIFKLVLKKSPFFGKAMFYLGMSYEGMNFNNRALDVYKNYYSVDEKDTYRRIMAGRMDYLVRRLMAAEVMRTIERERNINLEDLPDKSVAVLYFMNLSNDSKWRPLQKGLAEMIITDLSQVKELKVIERLKLNFLMDELRMDASGLMEEETVPRVGKLLGVKSVINGSYMITPDEKFSLDANVFQPETNYMPTTASYEGKLSELFRIEKELILKIINYFNIRLTLEQREQIFKIPTENMNAFLNYCMGLDAMDRNEMKQAQSFFQRALYIDEDFQEAKDKIFSPRVWEATHSDNAVRVVYEADSYARDMHNRRPEKQYFKSQLVSTMNRLQWMSRNQNAEFLPGSEFRRSFIEAETVLSLIPRILDEPPGPPGQ